MIMIKRLHDIGRRWFLGVAAWALAMAQAVTNQIAKARPILEASVRDSQPEADTLLSSLKQIDAPVLNVGYPDTLAGRKRAAFVRFFTSLLISDSPYGTILDSATRLILSFVFTDIEGTTAFATHIAPPRDRVWPEIR
jgi:hypothetical protein